MSEKFSLIVRFFVKHYETIAILLIIFGVIIFCIVYQPKKIQSILDLVGLKKIDINTPIDIDKAIVHFSKKANKKIPKGSHIIVRKTDIKIPNNAIKDNTHWKIMQNFTERDNIAVYDDDSLIAKDIKDNGEIFTVSARLEEFDGVISSNRLFDGDDSDYYNYKFFISLNKNGKSIFMMEYSIKDENLKRSEFLLESQTEEVVVDSLVEQECMTELEESLRSFYSDLDGCTMMGKLFYEGDRVGKNCLENTSLGKQIEIMLNEKNCKINCNLCDEKGKCRPCTDEDGFDSYACEYKSKCFSYYYGSHDGCDDMSMKINIPIKDCSAGNVWEYNFCVPAGEKPYYSVPENSACKNITPKRVKDNAINKSRFSF
jgi:hypothetical protein